MTDKMVGYEGGTEFPPAVESEAAEIYPEIAYHSYLLLLSYYQYANRIFQLVTLFLTTNLHLSLQTNQLIRFT